jgi:hypothetical protein
LHLHLHNPAMRFPLATQNGMSRLQFSHASSAS